MHPHPDFENVVLPRDFGIATYRMTPLSPAFVDEDFDAVMATAPLFGGFFGDWPNGLTRAANLIDLSWHEREFTARRSFSWIIRDAGGTYLGCFYLYPALGTRGHVTAALWLCDIPDRVQTTDALQKALNAWCADNLPTGTALTWTTSPALD